MKYVLLTMVLLLSGCYEDVYYEDFENGMKLCEANEGLEYLSLHQDTAQHYVHCNNGARFYVAKGHEG